MANVSSSSLNYSQVTQYISSIASCAMSTIGGALIGRQTIGSHVGALGGLAFCLFDEYLISHQKQDKHITTNSAFWSSAVFYPLIDAICPSQSFPLKMLASTVAGLGLSYLNHDFLDYREKLEVPMTSFTLINQLFDPDETLSLKELQGISKQLPHEPSKAFHRILNDLYQLHHNEFFINFMKILGISLSKAVFDALFIYILGSYSKGLFPVNLFSRHSLEALKNFSLETSYAKETMKILGLFLTRALVEFGLDSYENHVSRDQYQTVLEKSTELLTLSGAGRKILSDPSGRELIRNLRPDLTKLMYRGSNRLNYVFTESSSTLIALGTITTLAFDALAPYVTLIMPYQFLLKRLEQSGKDTAQKLSHADMELWEVLTDISSNIEEINLRDGEAFLNYKFKEAMVKQSQLEKKKEDDGLFKKGIEKLKTTLSYFLDVIYYRNKLLSRSIEIPQIPIVHESVSKVYDFVSSNLNLQIAGKELELALKRVRKIFEILEKTKATQARHTLNDQNKIIFKDYILKIEDDVIAKLNLELDLHQCYAITGKSGSGKTTTLIDLKQGVLGKLNSAGEISVGQVKGREPNIMFIDQHLYFPVGTSLIEVLAFPKLYVLMSKKEQQAFENNAIDLLKQLEIDSFSDQGDEEHGILASLNAKDFALSGGQQKKVALVQAILNQPDVLILDETFTGLDPHSLKVAKKLLKQKLPKTTLLVIDHHAKDDFESGFYDKELHFETGSVSLQNL